MTNSVQGRSLLDFGKDADRDMLGDDADYLHIIGIDNIGAK